MDHPQMTEVNSNEPGKDNSFGRKQVAEENLHLPSS
jgi:hypothetical protein